MCWIHTVVVCPWYLAYMQNKWCVKHQINLVTMARFSYVLERSSELSGLRIKTRNKNEKKREINSFVGNDNAIATYTVTWAQTHKWNGTWVECFPVTYICVFAYLMSPICIVPTRPHCSVRSRRRCAPAQSPFSLLS